jgi:hypothetical protein
MTEYEYEKYIATIDDVVNVIDKYGVAIIPKLLTKEECDKMNVGMWDTLEHLTEKWKIPIKRNDNDTWREMKNLYPKHSMLIQNWNIGHAQYIWDIRQNPKIVDIYAKIWDCNKDDLLVSFDAVSYHLPPEVTNIGWYKNNDWFHCDQSFTDSKFKCIQSWVTGYDVKEGDATLMILESSNKKHGDFAKAFEIDEKDDWYKLNDDELKYFIDDCECNPKRIKCPKGSMVLWDSRTIHCGSEALKTRKTQNFRHVVYVCYEPRNRCTQSNLTKKLKAYEEMRMTSHWPCKIKLFPKTPRTYGQPVYEVNELPKPKLSKLGLRLVGGSDK